MKAPLIAISRHRLATDGQGVTTLVAFHGCPLRCRYCINSQCTAADGVWQWMDAQEILREVAVDDLYFQATGGGVTFGGGEPLLHSDTIADFCRQCPPEWNICLETSLNVPTSRLAEVAPYVSHYLVDIKDMNPDTYHCYTSRDNRQVVDNLLWLVSHADPQQVTIRLPRIPGYNTPEDIAASRQQLAALGFSSFDCFTYLVPQPSAASRQTVSNLKQLRGLRHQLGRTAAIVSLTASLFSMPAYSQTRKSSAADSQQRKTTRTVSPKNTTSRSRSSEVVGATGGVDARSDPRAFVVPYKPGIRPGETVDTDKLYDVVEQMPQFPGGPDSLWNYLETKTVYPTAAIKAGQQGRVIVTFVVEKNGRITGAKVARSVAPLLDAEALRVVNAMPRWIPGRQQEIAVRVKYTVPVTFRLDR